MQAPVAVQCFYIQLYFTISGRRQESLALASMARDDPPQAARDVTDFFKYFERQ